jgi:hypothetical protein
MRFRSRLRILSFIPVANRAPQSLTASEFDEMKSKRATKERSARIWHLTTAMKTNTHDILNMSRGDEHAPNRSVSFLCLLRQVSSVLSPNRGNEARPDIEEALVGDR